ncbi:hypothetical protein F5Y18DRAFT_425759 [Xylariaceae sp. FL1019]|nr:hypothetical protein F5Y18DRAFT_425759 [Xylariaceae sp. FL1019]
MERQNEDNFSPKWFNGIEGIKDFEAATGKITFAFSPQSTDFKAAPSHKHTALYWYDQPDKYDTWDWVKPYRKRAEDDKSRLGTFLTKSSQYEILIEKIKAQGHPETENRAVRLSGEAKANATEIDMKHSVWIHCATNAAKCRIDAIIDDLKSIESVDTQVHVDFLDEKPETELLPREAKRFKIDPRFLNMFRGTPEHKCVHGGHDHLFQSWMPSIPRLSLTPMFNVVKYCEILRSNQRARDDTSSSEVSVRTSNAAL